MGGIQDKSRPPGSVGTPERPEPAAPARSVAEGAKKRRSMQRSRAKYAKAIDVLKDK